MRAQEVTNETVSHEDLGGARVHNAVSGVAHRSFENDLDALQGVRHLLSYLPQCSPVFAAGRPGLAGTPPRLACTDPVNRDAPTLDTIVPLDTKVAYDMNDVIKGVRSFPCLPAPPSPLVRVLFDSYKLTK